MNKKLHSLAAGLPILGLLGLSACSDSEDSNQLVPAATTIGIDDVTSAEGDSGSSVFAFTVALSQAHEEVVTVQYATVDGSAQGSSDYQPAGGLLVFEPGTTALTVDVLVLGDRQIEPDETFGLALSNATGTNVSIERNQGVGAILNDDQASISIAGSSAAEGDFGTTELGFVLTLGAELAEAVSVDYTTQDGSAQGGWFDGDYRPRSGTVVFAPGTTEQSLDVLVHGDLVAEFDETVRVVLSNPQGAGAFLGAAEALGTIQDEDREVFVDGDPFTASSQPQLAASGARTYVVWQDARNGQTDIYFQVSLDAGRTWNEIPQRLDTDEAGASPSTEPQICAAGDNVYVVWQDARNGSLDLYFNASHDGGATWFADDVRIDSDGPGAAASTQVRIACSGDEVYVAWIDWRNGGADVYFNHSQDGGQSWQPSDARLDTNLPGSSTSSEPRITSQGNQINVIWVENGDIYSNYSADGGATWQPAHVRVDADPTPFPNVAASPRVAAWGDIVYAVWQDERSGEADIYFNVSYDGGASFDSTDLRLDVGDIPGARTSSNPDICADGANVYVVWQDKRAEYSVFHDIYFTRSTDAGFSFEVDRRLDHGITGGKAEARRPVIACEGVNLVVAWSDWRNGPQPDAYASTSIDGGQTWSARPFRLDSDLPGSAASQNVRVILNEGRATVVWEDLRFVSDILARTFLPH